MEAPRDRNLPAERWSDAIARAWLTPNLDAVGRRAAADAVTVPARAEGDPRPGWLSRAFEAVRAATLGRREPGTNELVDEVLAELRAAGWPRALRLAEAAWVLLHVNEPAHAAQSLAWLRAHAQADRGDARPAAEVFWSEVAHCGLAGEGLTYGEALAAGLRADALARAAGLDLLRTQAAQSLAFVFLSVGDVEGACAVLPEAVDLMDRGQLPFSPAIAYNLLLGLMLGRRTEEAVALLQAHPRLLDTRLLPGLGALRALVAWVYASEGRLDEAEHWWSLPASAADADVPTLLANRAWIGGTVLLALGRPVQARSVVEECLAGLQAASHVPSPMNATQLYRVLSEACEALGDLRPSLDALKRSQASCFTWVGQSVQSRLQALHLAQGDADAGNERHARRLKALDDAVVQARAGEGTTTALRSSSFLAHVTHEMRNPLQGVIGMTSLLMMSDLDARQRQHLRLAHSSAQLLLSLCNDVLDLAKIEAGRFELRLAPVDVGEAVREAAEVFEAQSQAGGVPLWVDIDPALPARLLCDRLRLQQVCMNLIGNAVKFTEDGEVRVGVGWQPGALRVAVQDTGPGLEAAEVAGLFQEFAQAGPDAVRGPGGSGLGLALCRSLVGRMGGQIGVESRPGLGSTFWFVLPLAAPA